MKLQVTQIEFDFTCDDGQVTKKLQDALTNYAVGKVYEVENEDDIADAISDDTGWCVKSVYSIEV
jgi:hypothetical protein